MTFMDEWQKIAQTLKTVDIDCHSLCAAIVLYQKSTVHLSYGFIRFQQLVQESVLLWFLTFITEEIITTNPF